MKSKRTLAVEEVLKSAHNRLMAEKKKRRAAEVNPQERNMKLQRLRMEHFRILHLRS